MQLLHLTDIHGNQNVMDWALDMAKRVDAICITGDFLNDGPSTVDHIEKQIIQTLDWLSQLSCDVAICSGNHDELGSSWLKDSGVKLCDGQKVEVQGITFGAVPYGCEDFLWYVDCDVLLHHEPPARLKVAREKGRDYGSVPLLNALQAGTINPAWLLCGHVHYPSQHVSRFRNTRISNPGTNNRKDNQPSYHMITL